MEFGTIQREVIIAASPETVYAVVSEPEQVRQWWPDEASYEPVAGGNGEIVFGTDENRTVQGFTVIEASPPHRFSFRWTQPPGDAGVEGNSLLVTFELRPSAGGTSLTMTETGFREMGWEMATLEQQYRAHLTGWDFYLPRLQRYAAGTGNPS